MLKQISQSNKSYQLLFDTKLNTIYNLLDDESIALDRLRTKAENSINEFENIPQNIDFEKNIEEITIIFSENCNMSCKYCNTKNYNCVSFIGNGLFINLLNFLISVSRNQNNIHVRFYGGEPLLFYNEIKRIVNYSIEKDLNFVFSFSTNGTLLDEEKIKFIVENKIAMSISLDGPEEVHNKWRPLRNGSATYDLILDKLYIIKNKYPTYFEKYFSVQSVLTPDIPLMEKYRYFLELDVKKAEFLKLNTIGQSKLKIDKKEYEKFYIKQYESLVNFIIQRFIEEDFKSIIYFPFAHYFDLFRLHIKNNFRSYCGAGYKRIAITPKGELLPCYQFNSSVLKNKYVLGNLVNGINYERVKELYNRYIEIGESCKNCWLFYLCPNLCPLILLSKNDKFCNKDIFDSLNIIHELHISAYAEIKRKAPLSLDKYAEYLNRKKPENFIRTKEK